MQFEWKDRSERDYMALGLLTEYINQKVAAARKKIEKINKCSTAHNVQVLEDLDPGMYFGKQLLDVDLEWILGYMLLSEEEHRELGFVSMCIPVELLPAGCTFMLESEKNFFCDDDDPACCRYPTITIARIY